MMHYSMCEIKIGIVHQEHQGENKKIIEPAIFSYGIIFCCMWRNRRVGKQLHRNKRKNSNG